MSLVITNTLSGKKEPFETIEPDKVSMYVCGPTVYDEAHIGHAMSAIVFDIIRRHLEYRGYDVVHAQNFTDVDDKIIVRARELGVDPEALAEQLVQDWLDQTRRLNVLPATIYPRATQEIDTIVDMVTRLIDSGHAYESGGDVFYRVTSFAEYGKLSRRRLDDMVAGARIEIDDRKEHPMDFVLWKAAKPGEPSWESPWGQGRPGWHIECSAMIRRHLGPGIDIHGGGSDLIFPHHENEISQSEPVNCGSPLARYWVHNGMLQFSGEKMSKSIGNMITIRELLEQGDGDVFRFMVLGSHYRSPLTFTDDSREAARRGLERLVTAVRGFDRTSAPDSQPEHPLARDAADAVARYEAAMDDDFNTPVALAALFDLARAINREQESEEARAYAQSVLVRLSGMLGLTLQDQGADSAGDAAPFVDLLVELRTRLRNDRQWELSDLIRDQLAALGISLEDGSDGTTWRRR